MCCKTCSPDNADFHSVGNYSLGLHTAGPCTLPSSFMCQLYVTRTCQLYVTMDMAVVCHHEYVSCMSPWTCQLYVIMDMSVVCYHGHVSSMLPWTCQLFITMYTSVSYKLCTLIAELSAWTNTISNNNKNQSHFRFISHNLKKNNNKKNAVHLLILRKQIFFQRHLPTKHKLLNARRTRSGQYGS